MLPFSATQTALNELLRERLAAADCRHGCLEVSAPGAYLSLSGQKANGNTLFFWEFGHTFHRLLSAYLTEGCDAHTAQLTINIDVRQGQFQYSRLTKQQAAEAANEAQQAAERRKALSYQLVAGLPLRK